MGTITKKAFPVLNMHCAGCANNVEKTVRKLPGIVDASVNLATNTLSVSYEADKLAPGEIRAAVLSGQKTTGRISSGSPAGRASPEFPRCGRSFCAGSCRSRRP